MAANESSTSPPASATSVDQRAAGSRYQPHETVGATVATGAASLRAQAREYDNGYHFPPRYPWKDRTRMAIQDLWAFYKTGFGFFLILYALNVVAWGGMLFLLLCNAGPAMCVPDCNDINSPRRIWIEVDSQILNALFCVTGFGLAPTRIRDFYLLLKYRVGNDQRALRSLAGVHRSWFRLEGSQELPPNLGPKNIEEQETTFYHDESVPYPIETISDAPPTGVRATPTALWKLDFVIWFSLANTALQCVLSGFMWALDRYTRPSWSTGLFVALACIVAMIAGVMMGIESGRVKAIEGVALAKRDLERLARDEELGIPHYNNYNDKDPELVNKKKEKRRKKDERESL